MLHTPHQKTKLGQSFSRRNFLLTGGQLTVLGLLLHRLYGLQIIDNHRYQVLSDNNRIALKPLPPLRGIVFDRFGDILATNRINYHITLARGAKEDMRRVVADMMALLEMNEEEKNRVRSVLKQSNRRQFLLTGPLDWNQLARVALHISDLPGVSIEEKSVRYYRIGSSTGHILGHVGRHKNRPLEADLDIPVGISGMEKQYDTHLQGTSGTRKVEVDALGREIRNLEIKEPQTGQSLTLSIDSGLQAIATASLHQHIGAAVVMDCHTGEVLALASSPSFDPNPFSSGMTERQWQRLYSDPRRPLLNRAVSGQYAPGSTFKMIVALAALERGHEPHHFVFCSGHTQLNKDRFHCWRKYGHGQVDMERALRESCDVYFYELARTIGIQAIADMAIRLGLGKDWSATFPGAKSGLVPNPKWKKRSLNQSWFSGETLLTGIGQGYVLTTPLQLAVMIARLVNGGMEVVPHFIQRASTKAQYPSLGVRPYSLQIIKQAMDQVVNHPKGTAFGARISQADWLMGGKTGTSQVRRISRRAREEGFDESTAPHHLRDHALFVGYVPWNNPRYVGVVIVEHGGHGSRVAAPIVRDLLLATRSLSKRTVLDQVI